MGLREFRLRAVTSLSQTWVALYRAAQNTTVRKSTKAATDILLSLKTTHRPPTRLRALIEAAPDARLKRDLENGRHRGGRLAVQVTPAADQLWHFFEKTNAQNGAFTRIFWCRRPAAWWSYAASPAAIQTICMPRGMAWYGYGRFQDLHRVGNFSAFR